MRRLTFTAGLLLILASVYVLNQGVHVLYPFASVTGLISSSQSQVTILPSTLQSVPPLNYTYLAVELKNGMRTTGLLQVEGGSQIGFYIMNEGNFSAWRQGRPSVVSLARPSAINYNFTFIPSNSAIYYFLFNNPDPFRKNVIFTLSKFETVAIVNPLLQYAGYIAMLMGIVLSILAIKTGRKKIREEKVSETVDHSSKCKYCGEKVTARGFCSKCGRSQT